MTRSIRPLSVAVTNLLNRSLRTREQIAQLLGVDVGIVSNWFEGEGLPNDRQMSTILRDFELTSGSARTPHMPGVLSQFWDELRAIEFSTEQFWELPLEKGQTATVRLTEFTNDGAMNRLAMNVHMIHPSRRRAFFEAMIETLNRFTDD